ncbi:hypothetical protein [uncultured Bacteroides sp.]|nr:hypothetical protein [uncultured Bacteroides sp.]
MPPLLLHGTQQACIYTFPLRNDGNAGLLLTDRFSTPLPAF